MKLFFILLLRFNFFLTKFLVKITHLLIIRIYVYYVREREGKEQINCNEGDGEMLYFLRLWFSSQKTEATVNYNKNDSLCVITLFLFPLAWCSSLGLLTAFLHKKDALKSIDHFTIANVHDLRCCALLVKQ